MSKKYHIQILDAATEELGKLDKSVGRRIVKRIDWLAANLDDIQIEALTGEFSDLYKLRVGNYRVLYEILWSEQTILIHKVGHRRNVYR